MTLTLYIIRGLPGAGKSTLAKQLVTSAAIFEADQYFTDPVSGAYNWAANKSPDAHNDCAARLVAALEAKQFDTYVVSNTSTRRWEYEKYLTIGRRYGANIKIIDLFDAGLTDDQLCERTVHNVPLSTIQAMRARYEVDSTL
jgi:predicted kinase